MKTLDLSGNAFSGSFPDVGYAPALQFLSLNNNALIGDVGRRILLLTNLISMNVSYDGLAPSDPDVRAFFTAHQADWQATQTAAPADAHVAGVSGTTATLVWTPIPYTGDGGYYEILAVDPGTNATTPVGTTTNKSATGLRVTGLIPNSNYVYEVRTVTPAHGSQTNSVTSEPTGAIAVTTGPPTARVEETAPGVGWNSWAGVTDPAADGGSYRVSRTTNSTASFGFSGTSVTWLARKGPDRGRAAVRIDGVNKGTIDLYAAAPGAGTFAFRNLANRSHTITVKVLGTKATASSGASITVDGFRVGSSTTTVQESSPKVAYGNWTGATQSAASGGSYRVSATKAAAATFTFYGTGIDWITARGRGFGKASVRVDGGQATTVDLYRSTAAWNVVGRSITGLTAGDHTVVITVLGTKSPAATGKRVPVDAFVVHG